MYISAHTHIYAHSYAYKHTHTHTYTHNTHKSLISTLWVSPRHYSSHTQTLTHRHTTGAHLPSNHIFFLISITITTTSSMHSINTFHSLLQRTTHIPSQLVCNLQCECVWEGVGGWVTERVYAAKICDGEVDIHVPEIDTHTYLKM